MADPPQSPHCLPCPQSPSQGPVKKEIKTERDGDDCDIDSPTDADQQQSAPGVLDFEELLNRIAMQNQILADMQRSQLQNVTKIGFPNPAVPQGQLQVAGPIAPSFPDHGSPQIGISHQPQQMITPYMSMTLPMMSQGWPFPGISESGEFHPAPRAQPGPTRPSQLKQMYFDAPQQFQGFDPGYTIHPGHSNHPAYVSVCDVEHSMQDRMGQMMSGYVIQTMPSIRGSYLALPGRGNIQQGDTYSHGVDTAPHDRGNKQGIAPSRVLHYTPCAQAELEQADSFLRSPLPELRERRGGPIPSLQGTTLARQTQAGVRINTEENRPWRPDPNVPCCQCGSHVHQLKHHPNPNTQHEYLKGCFHCNKLSHSFSKCPYRHDLKKLKWYYLRTCRTGLCPAEDFRDFREIPKLNDDGMGQYSVEMYLPLTPQFAFNHPYPDERNFRHPLEGGDVVLFEDPFWESEDPLADLGCFGVKGLSADDLEQALWANLTRHRRSVLRKQVEERAKAYIEDEVSPDGLGMVPMNNLHSTRGTKRDRSSTPPPHQNYSIENPVRPSSHENLPTRAPRGHDKSSPESAITRQANGPAISHRQQKQESPQVNYMKRSRQRSPSPTPSESSFSDLSTKAVIACHPHVERPVKKRRRNGDESNSKKNDARSGSRHHDRVLSESTRSREELLRVRGYRPENSLQERTYACRACGTRRDSSPGCYLCR